MRLTVLLCLFSTVAGAQIVRPIGGVESPCGVTQSCAAISYEATTTEGPGFACNSVADTCVDLGPGAHNSIGTNGSGDVVLGPAGDSATIVRTAGQIIVSAGITVGNVLDVYNAFIRNSVGSVLIDDSDGLKQVPYSSLGTCDSAARGTRKLYEVVAADDRECLCIRLADGTSYAWRNTVSGIVGDATTCGP